MRPRMRGNAGWMADKGLKQAVEQILAARPQDQRHHSPLWTYIEAHQADVHQLLAAHVSWADIAKGIGLAGVVDRDGRAPSTPAVYQTFRRILTEAGESAVAPKRAALMKAGRAAAVGPKKETPAKPAPAKDRGPAAAVKMPSREWLE